ncbi:hypothetical protein DFS34DRAFT_615278 [Phlyctochytrium arcticum]|nr:hypothetical protein DFS34DRAFT_615278 [Phlyctochytrium arcticum]
MFYVRMLSVAGAVVFSLSSVAQAALTLPPPMPKAWPAIDQTVFITGALLQDPLVTEALAHVQSVVPAALLNIKPSTYIQFSTVTYNDNAANTCYWPANQCTRPASANINADIVTCPQQNAWGLTYDDGPTSNIVAGKHDGDTAEIRDKLNELGLKATFFVCGTGVMSLPAEVKATDAAGHPISSHTWTHHPLTSLTNAQIVAELKYTEAAIYQTIGKVPRHFRPPYGDIDDRVRAIASALGYSAMMWTTTPNRDTGDASLDAPKAADATKILNTVKTWNVAQPGFISLEHDISPFTSNVGVDILNWIQSQGDALIVKPQSVQQCLNIDPYVNLSGTGGSSTNAPPASTTSGAPPASTTPSTPTTASVPPPASTTPSTPTTASIPSGTTTAPTASPTATRPPVFSGGTGLRGYLYEGIVGALVAVGVQLF